MDRAKLLVDCGLILVAAGFLIQPLWLTEYLNNWGSIDSTFIADARFLKEHGPYPQWQPLWYCGTRFNYIYPPALRQQVHGAVNGNPHHPGGLIDPTVTVQHLFFM